MPPREIELLAPARDAATGIEAIRHGADAVYIGGPSFGARAAATNSVDDIARLAGYAHTFGARVYVTLNTILYDDELARARDLVWQLHRAGADALIVQDMGLLGLDLPPIALHASTQMDNRTAEKVDFLARAGFEQVVLARELSLAEIRAIHAATPVKLEAFVHGALCVSYSGRCYASQYCFRRSANRGECAQFCRLAFDLVDAAGRTLIRDKHLLSLRDMNRTADVEAMMEAGISSFKIEGRLKDTAYVKNVTAHYRRVIDEAIRRHPGDYRRASFGTSTYTFTPDPAKSFNRGFTDYYLHGRGRADVTSFDTPKARGEEVGRVASVDRRSFTVEGTARFANGDGLCFVDAGGRLQGFRLNRVEDGRLYPAAMPEGLRRGQRLYRNADQAFERLLSRPSAERRLCLDAVLDETPGGYRLTLRDEAGRHAEHAADAPHEAARRPQTDNIMRQLARLGDTPYVLRHAEVRTDGERFIPQSSLASWRRAAVAQLLAQPIPRSGDTPETEAEEHTHAPKGDGNGETPRYTTTRLDYTGNVANRLAREYYARHGVDDIAPAFELRVPREAVLMTCRHCLRYSLGHCPRQTTDAPPWREPLALRLPDGRLFPLSFDCANCQMLVHAPH